MSNCLMCGAWSSDDHADDCPNKPLTPSESKPSEAGAGEATVSGPTHGSPERERGDHAGPESQQPCSPPEAGAESEASERTYRCPHGEVMGKFGPRGFWVQMPKCCQGALGASAEANDAAHFRAEKGSA